LAGPRHRPVDPPRLDRRQRPDVGPRRPRVALQQQVRRLHQEVSPTGCDIVATEAPVRWAGAFCLPGTSITWGRSILRGADDGSGAGSALRAFAYEPTGTGLWRRDDDPDPWRGLDRPGAKPAGRPPGLHR